MNDHNLDDLIIDTIEPQHSKTKSFLTIIALLIVFLIVGIILAKIYTGASNNASLPIEENNTELIAPELKLQAPKKETQSKEEPSLSSIIEQKIKAPEVKAPEAKALETKPKETQVPVKPEAPKVIEKPIESKTETVEITQEFTQTPEVKTPVPAVKEIEIPTPEVKHEVPKKVAPVTVKKESPKTISKTHYFIQVGSFKQTPSTRFLSVIKNSGFNYSITKPTSNGVKKLLIGPYHSRASVDAALVQVRDRINKKAFVVKK